MKSNNTASPFSPLELRQIVFPAAIAVISIFAFFLFDNLSTRQPVNLIPCFFAVAGMVYFASFDRMLEPSFHYREFARLLHPIVSGVFIGVLPYIAPNHRHEYLLSLSVLSIVGAAISGGRWSAYLNLGIILTLSAWHFMLTLHSSQGFFFYLTAVIIYFALIESVTRIRITVQQNMQRLETINKVSRHIMMSLDTGQTISLLNATIQDALDADTYFIGIVKEGEVHLDLFYDDGEYFNGTRIPLQGTLTGWVIQNQKELFLPDMRKAAGPNGVGNFRIGKGKPSLSWMGIPLKAVNVTGAIVLASYKPNAFSAKDMELLSNLAQPITLALDNTIRHALVEERARLDSLTEVYNHGYFLQKLKEQAEESLRANQLLSLIMLDIDFFKQYNDTYGHLVGDRILNMLCTSIKQHIKRNDAVGRWGGEEFIISLVGASGEQAIQIAQRIGQTLSALRVEDRDGRTLPVPTVSQGIAEFPGEANEIYDLIDLADRRLYVAKERGRNQIEPKDGFWKGKQKSSEVSDS